MCELGLQGVSTDRKDGRSEYSVIGRRWTHLGEPFDRGGSEKLDCEIRQWLSDGESRSIILVIWQ
jgi:hypothetical protein